MVKAARLAVDIADLAKRMEVLGNAAVKFSQPDIQQDTEHALAPFSSFLEPNPRDRHDLADGDERPVGRAHQGGRGCDTLGEAAQHAAVA